MENFGKAQLLKYGWTEGKGLGKHENGIAEALKPSLKFDTTGIGHDNSEYHWWEFVYNKASNNINIDTNTHGVKINIKDKDAVDIKTSKSELNLEELKKTQSLYYGNFIKTSTLENGKVTMDPNYVEKKGKKKKKEKPQVFMLNDEDLFKACGGRTAHKGARHGLTLNGKLARIERQEQELLQKMNEQKNAADWVQVETKRKKKKKNRSATMDVGEENDNCNLEIKAQPPMSVNAEIIPTNEDVPVQSRESKRKAKRRLENLTHQLASSLALSDDSMSNVEKKSTRDLEINSTESSVKKGKNKKRKKKHCNKVCDDGIINDTDDVEIVEEIDAIIEPMMKKRKSDIITESSVLNSKIEKRKRNKRFKKERQRMEKLSTSLMTLDLVAPEETNTAECKQNNKFLKEQEKKL